MSGFIIFVPMFQKLMKIMSFYGYGRQSVISVEEDVRAIGSAQNVKPLMQFLVCQGEG